jgi:molecular chaperone GrpE
VIVDETTTNPMEPDKDFGAAAAPPDATELAAELAQANERALRTQAELENFRKRMWRELEDQQRYAALPLARDVVGVLDDVDRAIAAAEKAGDDLKLLEGIKLVRTRLASVLAQHGVKEIEAHDTAFDPAVHEAILQQPSPQHEPGSVMHVALPGYKLHERVVRPAQVVVAAKQEK